MDADFFAKAWASNNWQLVTAVVILTLVRLSKANFAGQIWQKVPKQVRPWVPMALGLISGLAESVIAGRPLAVSVALGFLSGLASIGIDQAVTKPFKTFTAEPSPQAAVAPESTITNKTDS
jgi:hypothetical protein